MLVTNDDGVRAPGIAALARYLEGEGHDVTVVAPLTDCSGAGAGVGPIHQLGGLAYETGTIDGFAGAVYGVDGLPAMAVITACLGAFGEIPEVVVSGINLGLNAGFSVLHSGTVGAALTASHFGISGVAVSIEWADDGTEVHWESPAGLVALVLGAMDGPSRGASGTDHGTSGQGTSGLSQGSSGSGPAPSFVLSLNVPNLPASALKGVRQARLAASGTIRSAVDHAGDGYLQLQLGRRSTPSSSEGIDAMDVSDVELVDAGYAALTMLVGVHEDESAGSGALAEAFLYALSTQAGALRS